MYSVYSRPRGNFVGSQEGARLLQLLVPLLLRQKFLREYVMNPCLLVLHNKDRCISGPRNHGYLHS
jgi:hypothetical protein